MKILVISGHSKEYSLGKIYPRCFARMGNEVYEYYDIPEMEKELALFKFPIFRRINVWRLSEKHSWGIWQDIPVYSLKGIMVSAEARSNKNLICICKKFKPDVLFVIKGKAVQKNTLLTIKERTGCVLAHYNTDDHNNLYSTSRNMLDSLPVYDIVFTWSRALFANLMRAGASRVEYLPFGYDEMLHSYEDSKGDYRHFGHDIAFVGTWDKQREEALSVLADLDLGIWGSRWSRVSRRSRLYSCIKGGEVDAKTTGMIYRNSKICLNVMRPQNAKSHNMRSFEIPALGGFMLTNRTDEHLELFEEGKEIACFEGEAELRSQVSKYLNDDVLRNEIAKRSEKKVRDNHSYDSRAKTIVDVFAKEARCC